MFVWFFVFASEICGFLKAGSGFFSVWGVVCSHLCVQLLPQAVASFVSVQSGVFLLFVSVPSCSVSQPDPKMVRKEGEQKEPCRKTVGL